MKNKVTVVTGGGGTLCSRFSEAHAKVSSCECIDYEKYQLVDNLVTTPKIASWT